jgi:hypothetical protein
MEKKETSTFVKIVLVIAIFVALIALSNYLSQKYHVLDEQPVVESPATTSVAATVPATTTEATTSPNELTHSNGSISFTTPASFGLAVNEDQVLVKSYIPPCEENFDYCLYYNGSEFKNTNFGGAGIRIKKRADLANQSQCLTAQPLGYTGMKATVVSSTTAYAVSMFGPIGDAGAGHYASGELYRLAYNGTCHEFETRISATQFANYPEGSIKEFSTADQIKVKEMQKDFLNSVKLSSGEVVRFVK